MAQFNIYANSQANQITDDKNKILLVSSFLKKMVVNWFEPYLRQHFKKSRDKQDNKIKAAFQDYREFIKQLSAIFGAVDKIIEAK